MTFLPESFSLVQRGLLLHGVAFLAVLFHLLRSRRDAHRALLWLFITGSFPLVGALAYAMFGVDQVTQKAHAKQSRDELLYTERASREGEALPLAYWHTLRRNTTTQPAALLARRLQSALEQIAPQHPVLRGNHIRPLVTGDEAFPAMLAAIDQARHHIHIQSFIIGADAVGRACLEHLAAQARAGVQVRVLYDRFGSTGAVLSGWFRRYRGLPNLQTAGWTQANLWRRQIQINLRNHRKIMVVDGQRAFTGGINLHAENCTRPGHPPIRDYHFEIQGPIAQELQYTFMRDWFYMTGESPDHLLNETYFPRMDCTGDAQAQVVNSGPARSRGAIEDMLFLAITLATRQILAVTPYFTPSAELLAALRAAAIRDVEVRLIIPAQSNHLYAGWAGQALYEDLLRTGVRIFERAPPFMHAKAMIVDDEVAIVGSANLDMRSLRVNYETNLLCYDADTINRTKALILEDQAHSTELNFEQWAARATWRKYLENAASWLAPML